MSGIEGGRFKIVCSRLLSSNDKNGMVCCSAFRTALSIYGCFGRYSCHHYLHSDSTCVNESSSNRNYTTNSVTIHLPLELSSK